jgi:hypothetical protein
MNAGPSIGTVQLWAVLFCLAISVVIVSSEERQTRPPILFNVPDKCHCPPKKGSILEVICGSHIAISFKVLEETNSSMTFFKNYHIKVQKVFMVRETKFDPTEIRLAMAVQDEMFCALNLEVNETYLFIGVETATLVLTSCNYLYPMRTVKAEDMKTLENPFKCPDPN